MQQDFPKSVGVAVITHAAEGHLEKCLPPLLNSSLKPTVLVMNSSSSDGTIALAERMGARTHVIPRHEFNHGRTRELARKLLNTDVVVFVTPDAYAEDQFTLEKLLDPLFKGQASVSYARQIPHKGADFFASFPRAFNYPQESHIRSLKDRDTYGIYTFFCSNSFAAWEKKALDGIGGFAPALIAEDAIALAKLLHQGHKVAFVAESVVHHSHSYTLWEEFKRHFDTGLYRKEYAALFQEKETDERRGKRFVREMLVALAKQNPWFLPYAFLHCFMKWAGYQAGRLSCKAPAWLKKRFSSQEYFW